MKWHKILKIEQLCIARASLYRINIIFLSTEKWFHRWKIFWHHKSQICFFAQRSHLFCLLFDAMKCFPSHQILTENTNCSQIRVTASRSWQLMMWKCLRPWCAAALSGRMKILKGWPSWWEAISFSSVVSRM